MTDETQILTSRHRIAFPYIKNIPIKKSIRAGNYAQQADWCINHTKDIIRVFTDQTAIIQVDHCSKTQNIQSKQAGNACRDEFDFVTAWPSMFHL